MFGARYGGPPFQSLACSFHLALALGTCSRAPVRYATARYAIATIPISFRSLPLLPGASLAVAGVDLQLPLSVQGIWAPVRHEKSPGFFARVWWPGHPRSQGCAQSRADNLPQQSSGSLTDIHLQRCSATAVPRWPPPAGLPPQVPSPLAAAAAPPGQAWLFQISGHVHLVHPLPLIPSCPATGHEKEWTTIY
jgi:hypothetical protein